MQNTTVQNRTMPTMAQCKQQERVQSWYEPALFLFDQILKYKQANLLKRGYPKNNAAVTKIEWRNAMASSYRLSMSQISEIEQSLYRANQIAYFGRDYMERRVMQGGAV